MIEFAQWLNRQVRADKPLTIECSYSSSYSMLPLPKAPGRLALRMPFNWRMYRRLEWHRRTATENPLDLDVTPEDPPHKPPHQTLRLRARAKSLSVVPAKVSGARHRERPVREMECVFVYREPELTVDDPES